MLLWEHYAQPREDWMGRAERAVRFAPRFIGPRLALNGPASMAKAREMRERRSGAPSGSIVDDESIDEGIARFHGARDARETEGKMSLSALARSSRGALERRP